MKIALFIFIVTLLTFANAYEHKGDCTCPSWDNTFPDNSLIDTDFSQIRVSNTSEIIDGTDFGKSLWFANKIWLSKESKTSKTTQASYDGCPAGYRTPTGDDLRGLVNFTNTYYASDPKGFLTKQ